jgi:hypothetical protein
MSKDGLEDDYIALEEKYEKIKASHDRYFKILRHLASEYNGSYFICGDVGQKDSMGLPEGILICPAYGLDGFCLYKKGGEYSAPGW